MPKVDDLYIEIQSDASDANDSLTSLVNTLDKMKTSIRGLNSRNLSSFSSSMATLNKLKFDNKGLQNFTNSLGRMGKNNPANGIKDLVGGFKELSGLNFDNKNLQSFVNSIGRLGKANVSGVDFAQLSSGMSSFVNTMSQAKNVDKSTIQITNAVASLAKQGGNIGYVSSGLPNLSNALLDFSNKMSGAKFVSANTIDFTKALGSLASAGKRTAETTGGLSALAKELLNMFNTLSKAPKLRGDIVRMAGALGDLARAGSRTSSATRSLSKGLNMFSASAGTATKKSFSLASAIGKLYATYWLLFRAFGKLRDSINIASDLTEVENVVRVSFGKYQNLVQEMAKTSITDFGMSELTVKQISSRFQAMGTAMGFAQGKMGGMSIELTKLAADMASFYNVEQKDVAEDLESIFTGMTRPLRTYGLDLTEATLKEWAMKQGMDANIESMGQMEKTMLRYQYVMANTGAAQGDFLRTQDTWANQVRILKQNLEQLSIVVGRTFINALKPLVKYLNVAVQAITQFAQMVSDALGKIFGWKYEVGSGGITADIDDAAGGADDLSDGIGQAANNAKKLKQQLQGFHELNVLTSDTTGASGGNGSGTGTGTGTASGGSWTQDADSMFKAYESEIDTLYQLGSKISETLSKTLSEIDWNSVYAKAQSFGVGLASFLNGLITPELFGNIGTTIANALNTVLTAANTFAVVFDWKNLGNSLAQSVNDFFDNFDWKLAADTMNNLVDGLKDAIKGFFDGLTWDSILGGLGTFLGNLELDTVGVIVGGFALKHNEQILASKLGTALTTKIGSTPVSISNIALIIAVAAVSFAAGTEIGKMLFPDDTIYYDLPLTVKIKEIGLSVADGSWSDAIKLWQEDIRKEFVDFQVFCNLEAGMSEEDAEDAAENAQKLFDKIGGLVINASPIINTVNTVANIKKKWEEVKKVIGELVLYIKLGFSNWKENISENWKNVQTWWGANKSLPISTKAKSAKKDVKSLWKNIKSIWNSGKKEVSIATTPKLVSNAYQSIQNELNKTPLTLHANVEFKIENGRRLNWDAGVQKWFYYDNGQKIYVKKEGGIFSGGKWKNIPQYAEGGFPSHGTHFIAGEHGAEVVGHINGQTEVLNQSQLASVMYESMQGANAQTNALLVRQNQLLQAILEKETGINYKDVFKAAQKGASDYSSRTGRPAFA